VIFSHSIQAILEHPGDRLQDTGFRHQRKQQAEMPAC
jgi:hypothetical protein